MYRSVYKSYNCAKIISITNELCSFLYWYWRPAFCLLYTQCCRASENFYAVMISSCCFLWGLSPSSSSTVFLTCLHKLIFTNSLWPISFSGMLSIPALCFHQVYEQSFWILLCYFSCLCCICLCARQRHLRFLIFAQYHKNLLLGDKESAHLHVLMNNKPICTEKWLTDFETSNASCYGYDVYLLLIWYRDRIDGN